MPLDASFSQASAPARAVNGRPAALWLFLICGMLLVMVALGGATRLTGSGLSIMEWAPLSGALPPLGEAEWRRLYALYQAIPQYELVNKGFGLEGFKAIFWLEWTHRLWGRLLGVAFAVPLLVLWWRGLVPRRLLPRLLLFLALGGLQGAVGWFMVASGFFADATAVAPVRLALHLGLAILLYAAVLWTALDLWRDASHPAAESLRRSFGLRLGAAAVLLTMLAGGFVAGLKAGLTYNTYPLMDGRLIPEGYRQHASLLGDWTGNVAAVQFNHRLLATATALLLLGVVALGWRHAGPALRRALGAVAMAVLCQYVLGVLTLLWVVPPTLGALHQGVAFLLLTSVLIALHLGIRAPGARATPPVLARRHA